MTSAHSRRNNILPVHPLLFNGTYVDDSERRMDRLHDPTDIAVKIHREINAESSLHKAISAIAPTGQAQWLSLKTLLSPLEQFQI